MPLDSIILSIAVSAIFLAFAGVLAWADYSTSSRRPDEPKAPIAKHAA